MAHLRSLCLAALTSRLHCQLLEHGRGAVKHKDWPYLIKKQSTDAAEEPQQVPICYEVAIFIAHCLHELEDPHRSICATTGSMYYSMNSASILVVHFHLESLMPSLLLCSNRDSNRSPSCRSVYAKLRMSKQSRPQNDNSSSRIS
jgi:hypothetical protein